MEAKTTTAKSYAIKAKDIESLRKNAAMDGKTPIFVVDFNAPGQPARRLYIIDSRDVVIQDDGRLEVT